jgi:hypothetical protein
LSRRLRAGEAVGYGNAFVASKDTWIATVPVGYGDGYLYAFQKKPNALSTDSGLICRHCLHGRNNDRSWQLVFPEESKLR